MSSKSKKVLIGGCLMAALLLAIWYYFAAFSAPLSIASKPFSHNPASSSSPTLPLANNPTGAHAPTAEEMQAAHEAEAERERGIWNMLFLTPITFYGKVVDETTAPIEGAKALLHPNSDMGGGTKDYERFTDENGLFSISGIHGVGLVVNISKDGYYLLSQSSGNFGYVSGAGMQSPHTDPRNPAIFILRKMGETEPLIKISREVNASKDGSPTQVNLTTGHTYHETNGDIQVESWANIPTSGNYKNYDWRCKITMLKGGGLQPYTGGDFNFKAPEDGYQPSDEIDMPTTDPKWSSSQSRSYFLKLANGDYARIDFRMAAGGDYFFDITSYLNPMPGHRNLEYDPAKQINK